MMDKRTTPAQEDDEGPCTDCDDTGVTIQTERRCACQGPTSAQEAESELVERLRAKRDSGRRNIGGAVIGTDGSFETWGGEKIMALVNPDGPAAADRIERLEAALREAILQLKLEYMGDHSPGGTTPAVIARARTALGGGV